MLRAVTVYCSSSAAIPSMYMEAGEALGCAIAREGWTLVYGGNAVGLMGRVADSCRGAGGSVIGITPRLFVEKGIQDGKCCELVVCETMRERKGMMEERGDAFVAMPGGLGTLEELFEIIVGKQLRYHSKPIVLFNVGDFFGPLLAMIEHGIEQKFIKDSARALYFVSAEVGEIVNYLKTYRAPEIGDKWFSHTTTAPATTE